MLTRPSYVLGGRAMEIVDSPAQLDDYIHTAVQVSGDSPVLIDQYLRDAIEVDVDAICDGDRRRHRRRHAAYRGSGRPFGRQRLLAAALQPRAARSSPRSSARREALAEALGVVGLMNVQFAVKDGVVYLIEVNPRASRTVPFVAKAIGTPIAKIAARVMAGEKLADLPPIDRDIAHIAVKEAVFPFARFPGIDPVLSPEMKSTGEVMGIASDFADGLPQVAAGRGARSADRGHAVRLGQGQRQADRRAGGARR